VKMAEIKIIKRIDGEKISYVCPVDGTVLVKIGDGSFESVTSCNHFEWNEMTKACFYLGIGDIDPEELQFLRRNAILTLSEGIFVNVLVPKT